MATKKSKASAPAHKVDLYDRIVASDPMIQRKGAANPYTSMNGNMFSFLSKDGRISFRLGKEQREELLSRFPDAISVQYGAVMREYIEIPEEMEYNEELLTRLFADSVAYARTLKPKPTTKQK